MSNRLSKLRLSKIIMVEVPIFFALSAGFVAAFNPCGAPMLPAYMGYQLNLSTSNEKLHY